MEKVVLIGLGALGLTYAVKLKDKCDLYILGDKTHIEKYITQKPLFNGVEQDFNYILPSDKLDADLIIIATKSNGLNSAIECIRNFVTDKTKIISLINGISSEAKISETYPDSKVLKSYFIGHSAERTGNSVTQDGIGDIVIERDKELEDFFTRTGIDFQAPDDIEYSMWLKFTLNMFSNPASAILNMKFGEMRRNKHFVNFAKHVIEEVKQIAIHRAIQGIDNLEKDALDSFAKMSGEGKTSMFQDILAKRPTEIDIFCGEIIKSGKKYGVQTPYNQVLYDLIKIKEEDNEYSLHSCQSGK